MKKSALVLFTLFSSFLFLSSATSIHAQATATDPILQNCDDDIKDLGKNIPMLIYLACAIDQGSQQTPAPWYQPTPFQFADKVFHGGAESDVYGERYTFAQINWIINSLLATINPMAGKNPAETIDYILALTKFLSYNPGSPLTPKDYAQLGPLMLVSQAIEWPYTHPVASGVQEIKTMATKIFDLGTGTQPAYAQGLGYAKLGQGTIRSLWTATRNISYLIIVVLLIASGFMVMFRTKINPQTVVTIQMIIPKLAISLVLITFSYAIVGFVIDMIYVAIVAVLGLLNISGVQFFQPGTGLATAITQFTGDFHFVSAFLAMPIITAIILIALLYVAGVFIGTNVAGAPTNIIANIALPLLGLFFALVSWALYVWARVFGQLLFAYLNLSLLTISGPLQIALDIIPGKENNALKWFKCVVGNASVFVMYAILAIIAIVLFHFGNLSRFMYNDFGFQLNTGVNNFNPNFALPFFTTNLSGQIIQLLLAMGYFTAVPGIVNSVKDFFCKGEDQSKTVEGLAKEFWGSIHKGGQEYLGNKIKALPNPKTAASEAGGIVNYD